MNPIEEINRAAAAALDLALVGMIEDVDGRVPSGAEVSKYGLQISLVGTYEPDAFTHFFVWRNQHVLGWAVELFGSNEGVALGHGARFVCARVFPDDQPFALRAHLARLRGENESYA